MTTAIVKFIVKKFSAKPKEVCNGHKYQFSNPYMYHSTLMLKTFDISNYECWVKYWKFEILKIYAIRL